MLPTTTARVPCHTSTEVNERIRQETEENVAKYAARGPAAIAQRLHELDHEWDIERTLETNAASAVLAGVALGALVDRKFFLLPGVVAGFLLQHAIQGWCPPLPIFRRLGVRTQSEIEEERYALKALRGDFEDVGGNSTPISRDKIQTAMRAVRQSWPQRPLASHVATVRHAAQ